MRSIYRSLQKIMIFLVLSTVFVRFLPFSAYATVYRSVHTDKRQIALSFDDGPHPRLTPEILDILDEYGVRATFFMIGVNVENYPDAAREVIKRGHEVGNHTYHHRHVEGLDEGTLALELTRCEDALEELCEYRPHLFRPPEGAINEYICHSSDIGDYSLILWSLDTRDWEEKNAEVIASRVLSDIQPGDIILMHDYIGNNSKTPQALKILLPKLMALGYEPVTVSQLLGLG